MIKLFTDSDLDGIGCGLVAKLAFGDEVDVAYCSYRNLNERVERFIDDQENNDAKIYITDLAVNEDVEKKLAKRFKNGSHVQMVDHHVTAMHFNQYEWGFVQPEYEDGRKTSATSLYYEFLLEKNLIKSSPALAEFIELVRQYDTWEWEVNENTNAKRLNDLFFIISMEQFETEMLERLKTQESFSLNDTENMILDIEEEKIERYINAKNRQLVQTFVGDYCVGIVHAERYLSELGNALAKLNPHIDLITLVNVGTKKLGFRTIYDHVDVSAFAKQFGGGGHPKASGATLTKETFEMFVVNVFDQHAIRRDAPNNELNVKENKKGTFYVNRKREFSKIHKVSEQPWAVLHNNNLLEGSFETFDQAEHYVKRNYGSGIAFDNEVISLLAESLKVSEEDVRKSYQEYLEKH
ncbi:oligoribonuclease [Bacillus luteolus]|uniref:Oligoribonuclease n=1 Tax=Litchfieldia luteola TaxID=682179 RepID=A0ABR9QNB0_9BACI|nr:DHHA1 domain-containing protein [Cytobacillus luteolus]MBE4909981.1 oligoribonuclease [Cytobacillus luteolus]MBP1942460.1 oligoribonuclease NrnB/cAMP/cGMP phosphodiesterase (DHH superfamily) [Cytobacillus luteolus]